MCAKYLAAMAQRMLANRIENGTVFWVWCTILMVDGDLFERFGDEGTNPDANVCGTNVHQTETGNHFEAMNVELKIWTGIYWGLMS